ncbi:MAG TPA: putative Ig domain-containing protein [Leptospiraceae bacterium]|nr:putative Ig domain-containing protein [Leptospiraceae bacterium]
MLNIINILIIILFLLQCTQKSSSDLTANILYSAYKTNQVTLTGRASKGPIKNGNVFVTALRNDGTCNKADRILGTGYTDLNGDFSVPYTKTGYPVCVFVVPNSSGTSKMYDEKADTDIAWTDSNSSLIMTMREPPSIKKSANVMPFGKIGLTRLSALLKGNTDASKNDAAVKQVNKELTIRFGLNTGLSSTSKNASPKASINGDSYPEITDIQADLSSADDPYAVKMNLIMAGMSYMANQVKDGKTVSDKDIEKIMTAFASDYEDGLFNGKDKNGSSITVSGTNPITFSSNPLTDNLGAAISSFIKEGGKLNSSFNLTASGITSSLAFNDNAVITLSAALPGLTFSNSQFMLIKGTALPPITPSFSGGTLTSCSISPALPSGLTMNSATCAISGTPAVTQHLTSYTVSATNSTGTGTSVIGIMIASGTTATVVYGQNGNFTTSTPTVTATGLSGAGAILFDSNSNAYIADQMGDRVLFYPSGSTTASAVYGTGGSWAAGGGACSASGLNDPIALALDSSNNLYIAENINRRVTVYPSGSTTAAVTVYGETNMTSCGGGTTSALIGNLSSILIDSTGGLYVSDQTGNRILYYPAGSTVPSRVIGQVNYTNSTANAGGSTGPTGFNTPTGIALDSAGGLYVADQNNHRVLYFPAGSTTAARVYGQTGFSGNTAGTTATTMNQPFGVAVDSMNGLYVAEFSNNRILYFPSGSTVPTRVWGQPTFTTGAFSTTSFGLYNPINLTLSNSGALCVAEYTNKRVLCY